MSTVPELIAKMIGQQISHINTMFPAVVTKVNTYTCDVKPKFYYEIEKRGQKFPREFPILRDVPVVWPKGGKSVIKMPIVVNDVVLVGCSQVSLSKMLIDLTEVKADTSTRFDMKDAFILGGIVPENNLGDEIYDGVDYKIPAAPIIMSDGPICLGAPSVLFGCGELPQAAELGAVFYGVFKKWKQVWIQSEAIRAPTTNPAVFVDAGISGAWRFLDNTQRIIIGKLPLVTDFDITADPKFEIGWFTPTISQICRWKLEYLWCKVDDDMTAVAQGTITQSETSSSVANGLVRSSFTLPYTEIESTDICLLIRLTRMGDEVLDTLGDYAYLSGMCLHYLSNKLGSDS